MNANALNLALAKWDGWKRIEPTQELAWGAHPKGYPETKVYYYQHELPRYTESLDAVHELESKLTVGLIEDYVAKLNHVISAMGLYGQADHAYWFAHATAMQRCEALARTLNLWQE